MTFARRPIIRQSFRNISFASFALVILALAGCGGGSGLGIAQGSKMVGSADALAVPPPGGPAVLDVVQRTYPNAVAQQIYLSTDSSVPGQNTLDVAYFGPVADAGTANNTLEDQPLAFAGIPASLRSNFQGVAMQRSPFYVQNAYGPFGYAVGRSGRDTCLYGWQRITAPADAARLFVQRGTIQLRLRYCKTGASEAELLNVMYGFTLTGFFDSASWNPYGAPQSPPKGLGRTGHPVYPASVVAGAQAVLPAATARARRPSAPAPARKASPAPEPQSQQPLPTGPKVPLPPVSGAPAMPQARTAPPESMSPPASRAPSTTTPAAHAISASTAAPKVPLPGSAAADAGGGEQ